MKWLKLLEIDEKCQLCNGCGNSDHFKDLLSAGETRIFKKKDGRDGVLQEQQRLRPADCNVLLTADETDKCQACKNCNHYL